MKTANWKSENKKFNKHKMVVGKKKNPMVILNGKDTKALKILGKIIEGNNTWILFHIFLDYVLGT